MCTWLFRFAFKESLIYYLRLTLLTFWNSEAIARPQTLCLFVCDELRRVQHPLALTPTDYPVLERIQDSRALEQLASQMILRKMVRSHPKLALLLKSTHLLRLRLLVLHLRLLVLAER